MGPAFEPRQHGREQIRGLMNAITSKELMDDTKVLLTSNTCSSNKGHALNRRLCFYARAEYTQQRLEVIMI